MRSATIMCSQGDPPDLWQPPGDGFSVRFNPGGGDGGSSPGADNGTGSEDSKEDCWGRSNLGSSFPTHPRRFIKVWTSSLLKTDSS